MNYKLIKTAQKSGAKYLYEVVDLNGKVISERRSDREYVACTINGSHYFGRLDLIGKGDHGNYLKMCQGYRRDYVKGRHIWIAGACTPVEPAPIAYLETEPEDHHWDIPEEPIGFFGNSELQNEYDNDVKSGAITHNYTPEGDNPAPENNDNH